MAMSATLDADRLRRILGGSSGGTSDGTSDGAAPLVEVPGRLHPLEEVWAPPGCTGRLGPRGVPREFLAHVTATVERALDERSGAVVIELLARAARAGTSVLMVTHDPAVAAAAQEVLVLRDGVIEERLSRPTAARISHLTARGGERA